MRHGVPPERRKLLHGGPPADLTRALAGRVFRVRTGALERRKVLEQALDRDDVTDGAVQGASLRLVMKPHTGPPGADALGVPVGTLIESVAPRFEDAFVDILGGGPSGTSALAQGYRTIAANAEPAILATGLTRRFGDFTAAADISFSIPRGEIFGLLGPNGAGKSTTFKMLCGLLTPSSGNGRVAGHDLRTARGRRTTVPGLHGAEILALWRSERPAESQLLFRGVRSEGAAQRAAIERMVEIFHLGDYLATNSGTLPLGFKQRLALACAVMHQPPVLFLDEPTSGVDPIVRREFWAHINGLVKHGVTVLVTTHFMDEADIVTALP